MSHFRQLADPETSTYTYILGDPIAREAVIIDPVREQAERDLQLLGNLGLSLKAVLETHVHADHVTGAAELAERTGAETVVSRHGGAPCADRQVADGDTVVFGGEVIRVIATPGHTARTLYRSVTGKLFLLPDETLVYPGHDYNGRCVTSIGQERGTNPRLGGTSEAEFVAIMEGLNLPEPRHIHEAVPANQRCGRQDAA